MAKKKKNQITPIEEARFQVMVQALLCGITPDEYAEFFAKIHGEMAGLDLTNPFDDSDSERECDFPPARKPQNVRAHSAGLKDAPEKTLKLRVQMQDVTKPPMWRELKVPADFTFLQLHEAIQKACGFEDAHLWQFQRKAYDPELQIGVPKDDSDPYGFGMEDCTHDARTTGITAFLAEKGQKLVYVYDFGDDWIFTVSVVDVVARDGEVAECTRWKCDMQPMEDSGGVWSYLQMRQVWDKRESLKKKEKKDIAESLGYDSFDDLLEAISDCLFDPEAVNVALAEI